MQWRWGSSPTSSGDALTCGGVPFPLLWIINGGRLAFLPLCTGATVEKAVLAPAFLLATIVFIYLNTAAGTAVQPLVGEPARPRLTE